MFDQELLRRLADCEEVRERGRSEVVRRAVAEYLKRREKLSIARRYKEAYSNTTSLDDELEGWTGEGAWPET